MISENELYKFIGLAVVLLFVVSVGIKCLEPKLKF